MRLTEQERQLLALLEAALNVSEYTDNVDALSRRSKVHRILEGLRDMCAISAGLYVCSNLRRGERLCENSLDSAEAEELLQRVFEVGRRFKIMNPSKMRSSYGKLMWMLQDGMSRSVEEALGISLWRPINMVATFLEDRGAEALLCDARILTATQNVSTVDNDGQPRPREEIEALLAEKRESMRQLLETYGVRRGGGGGGGTPQQKRKDLAREAEKGDDESEVPDCGLDQQPVLTREEVEAVIASIDDANSYLAANVGPVECILDLLTENFHAATYEKGFSLALGNGGGVTGLVRGALGGGYYGRGFSGGVSGGFGARAKLSHDHRMQFTFVFQTFTLWKEIMSNMYKLWCLADEDLLSGGHGGRYQLLNTGQGLNRVQSSPRVAKEMHRILAKVQRQVGGSWVGLSVVHLGDRDVPNALVFIDKYTQIPHILNPIVRICGELDAPNGIFASNPAINQYIDRSFGGLHKLKLTILADFFKHSFDGDGDDGGSCIDGRLTSTWNWCSRIVKKPYYHAFNLAGFQGFDGDWKD